MRKIESLELKEIDGRSVISFDEKLGEMCSFLRYQAVKRFIEGEEGLPGYILRFSFEGETECHELRIEGAGNYMVVHYCIDSNVPEEFKDLRQSLLSRTTFEYDAADCKKEDFRALVLEYQKGKKKWGIR